MPPPTSLWKDQNFLKLWTGQTISQIGSQITLLAFAITAESVLHANAFDMGLLGALQTGSFLLVGLFAGVVVDRVQRRRILIVADLSRGLLLATVPAAVFYSELTLHHLYAVAFAAGIFSALFDIAYQAYLPSIVSREQLIEGNSKLEVSRNVAQLSGPAFAGALIKLCSAPLTIILDSFSYLLSAIFLLAIKQPEPEQLPVSGNSVFQDIKEGLSIVLRNPILRAIAFTTSSINLFFMMQAAIIILLLRRELGFDELTIGILFGLGGAGGIVGALISKPVTAMRGTGQTIIFGALVFGVAAFAVPIAAAFPGVALAVLIAGQMIQGFSVVIYDINQISLRQSITPNHQQGRMNATMKFLILGNLPVGAFIGGWSGDHFGLFPTFLVAAIGSSTSFLWALRSPLRGLRSGRDAQHL